MGMRRSRSKPAPTTAPPAAPRSSDSAPSDSHRNPWRDALGLTGIRAVQIIAIIVLAAGVIIGMRYLTVVVIPVLLALIGLMVGAWDGFIGPGTGSFFLILLVAVMGYEFLGASALAKIANLTTNLAAIAVFTRSGNVVWGLALTMAAANLCGGLLGARTAVRRGNAFVRKVFLVVVALLAAKLAMDSLRLVM